MSAEAELIRIDPDDDALVDAYLWLLHDAYQEATGLGVHFKAATATREEVVAHLHGNTAWAFRVGGELVTTVSLRWPWGPNPGPYGLPHFGWLAVPPAHKGQGWGARIMGLVETEVLGPLRLPAVSLGTAEDHPFLGAMYERQGFHAATRTDLGLGHITQYYLKPLDPAGFARWVAQHPDLAPPSTKESA